MVKWLMRLRVGGFGRAIGFDGAPGCFADVEARSKLASTETTSESGRQNYLLQ